METSNLNELMSAILSELLPSSDSQMSPEVLDELKAFSAEKHDPGETYDFIVSLSRKSLEHVNGFVIELCALDKYYSRPDSDGNVTELHRKVLEGDMIRMMDYMVRFKLDLSFRVEFDVYPVSWYTDKDDNAEKCMYRNVNDESDLLDEFDEKKCLKAMVGSYTWRGCWEGRVYFTDDEYWGEDFIALAKLYSESIAPKCRELIKAARPEANYDERIETK